MVAKKITEEELFKLKEIETTYYKTIIELGKFTHEKELTDRKIKHLDAEISLCIHDLDTLSEQERDLKEKLKKKYGDVIVDALTGEIS